MTAQAIAFNLNDMVRVKLTDKGREVHRADYDKLCEGWPTAPAYRPPEEDAEGWSVWQLWCLMHQMGPHCSNGGDVPVETGIEFLAKPPRGWSPALSHMAWLADRLVHIHGEDENVDYIRAARRYCGEVS